MEPQEPVSSTVELTIVTQTSTRASTNKRRCRNKAEGPASTSPSQDPQALALPVSTIASENAAPTGRKRKSSEPSAPIRRSPRLSNEQSTPGRGTGVLPEFVTQSDQVTGHWQPPPPSPLAASQRPYRIQLSRAKRNLHGAGPRAGSVLFADFYHFSAAYWRALSCHRAGPPGSLFLRLMTGCPLTGSVAASGPKRVFSSWSD